MVGRGRVAKPSSRVSTFFSTALPPREHIPRKSQQTVTRQPSPRPLRPRLLALAALAALSDTMNNTMVPREMQDEQDLAFMDQAVAMVRPQRFISCRLQPQLTPVQQAEEALAAREIPVGCVLVHDGKVVARGRNRTNEGRNATLHAEFDALRHLLPDRSHAQTPGLTRPYTPQAEDVIAAAAEKEGPVAGGRKIWQTPLKGVVLYVTVEPCLMCASAMRQVGIEKVVYGCANDRFGGTGGVQSIHSECAPISRSPCRTY